MPKPGFRISLALIFIFAATSFNSLAHAQNSSRNSPDQIENPQSVPVTTAVTHSQLVIPLFSHITKENIAQIFTYPVNENDPDEYGAKAVVVSLHNQVPTVYFFPIGNDAEYFNIHHEQVLLMAERQQLVMATGKPHASLQVTSMEKAQGFQLQAKSLGGKWRVTGFDVNSSITDAQQRDRHLRLSHKLQNELLAHAVGRIDSSLVGFFPPSWPARLRWKCEDIFAAATSGNK